MADFFVIGTAQTGRQIAAMTEETEHTLKRVGQRVWHTEGLASFSAARQESPDGAMWVLMDCGDVVLHVFTPPARAFYQLERLWGDAPRIPVTPSAQPVSP